MKIEKTLVRIIKSDIRTVRELVGQYSNPAYIKEHVQGKLLCIRNELDYAIASKEKEEERRKEKEEEEENIVKRLVSTTSKKLIKPSIWLPAIAEKMESIMEEEEEEEGEESEEGIESRIGKKMIKTSEWLLAIGKKMEKIKKLVSQFGSLPDENGAGEIVAIGGASSSTSMPKKLSDTRQCIEESLLISPIIHNLKQSYDHLPPKLGLCVLCAAVFPENFVIKKRPLIYWWIAEGFAQDDDAGEGNFMELIRAGFIQPFYEGNIGQQQGDPTVHACTVHPWIRRMLVSIALEANFFEFYGREKKDETKWARVCLYNEEEDDKTASWKTKPLKDEEFHDRLKHLKANLEEYEQYVHDDDNEIEGSNMPNNSKYFYAERLRGKRAAFAYLRTNCINEVFALLAEWKIKPWHDLKPIYQRIDDLQRLLYWEHDITTTWESSDLDNILGRSNYLMKLPDLDLKKIQNQLEVLHSQVKDFVLDLQAYDRKTNCEKLQKNDGYLFRHYDLKVHFPSPMKRRISNSRDDGYYYQEGKLLGIINVNRVYLNKEEEWFGKLKKLRTLHLGRWQDSLPIPHIEVGNTGILKALFQVAKHLKYVSLRGISRIVELPSTISECCNLQILDLKACYNLESLPPQIGSLAKLTHFDISECYLLHQNLNLWSSLQNLELLRTLKGLKWETDLSQRFKLHNTRLRKLSIIFAASTVFSVPQDCLCDLSVLTLTWRMMPQKIKVDIQQLPQNLRKLDLRCYPQKKWPVWLHDHPALETLYITGGNIQSFPTDLNNFNFHKLQILRFKYLTKPKLDFPGSRRQTSFPSLQYYAGLNFSS